MHDRRVLRGEVRRCDDGINSVSDCPLHQWQHICFKTGRHVWPPTAAMFVSETNIVFTIHTIANMHGLVKKNFRGDVFFIFSMSTMHKMCTIEKRKPRTDPRRGDTGIRQPRDGSLESVGRGVNRATRRWLQVASTALHRVQSIPQSLPIGLCEVVRVRLELFSWAGLLWVARRGRLGGYRHTSSITHGTDCASTLHTLPDLATTATPTKPLLPRALATPWSFAAHQPCDEQQTLPGYRHPRGRRSWPRTPTVERPREA